MSVISIEEITLNERSFVGIREKCNVGDIGTTCAKLLPKIYKFLLENKIELTSAPSVRYYEFVPQKTCDMEAGMYVNDKDSKLTKELLKKGGCEISTVRGGSYVKLLFEGPYTELPKAWNKIFEYAKEKGKELEDIKSGESYECYIDDPSTVKIPKTEVYYRYSNKRKERNEVDDQNKKTQKNMNGGVYYFESYYTDMERIKKFYSELFKWTFTVSPMMEEYLMFSDGANHLRGGFIKIDKIEVSNTSPVAIIFVDDAGPGNRERLYQY